MAGATGSFIGGGFRLAVALFIIFALVCFMGIQDLRAHRERESKNAELDAIFRDLQEARQSQDDLQRMVADLTAEKLALAAVKSNTSTLLLDTQHKKQLLVEEKTRLEAALGDKDGQISTLKEQVRDLEDSEREVERLRSHLKALEEQLEHLKANTSSGAGLRQETTSEDMQRQQGEDLEHGLVAADKADVGVDGDLDDRKREQLDGESDKVDEDLDAVKTLNQDALDKVER